MYVFIENTITQMIKEQHIHMNPQHSEVVCSKASPSRWVESSARPFSHKISPPLQRRPRLRRWVDDVSIVVWLKSFFLMPVNRDRRTDEFDCVLRF